MDDTPAPHEVIEEVVHQEPVAAETITAYAAPQLANTGASVVALTGLAGLATLAGAGAIAAGRRRV